ncbi:hypothetical protein GYH73_028550 [Bacillus megaterium]|nr:hypothetical protein [Priestia megaterium]
MQETKKSIAASEEKRSGGSFGNNVISWGIMSGIYEYTCSIHIDKTALYNYR